MASPRTVTVDELNNLLEKENYSVIKRELNPNYCTIQFKDCGHTKLKTISSIKGGKLSCRCDVCFEQNLANLLDAKGFNLLAKIKYGESKFSGEYRLATCKKCGNFIAVLPSSIYISSTPYCYMCDYLDYIELAKERGYKIINRIDRYYVKLRCKCGNTFKCQGSNLKRGVPRCPVCGKVDRGSMVYVYKVVNGFGSYLKIGKSNNPYLRHLSFNKEDLNLYDFVASKKFKTESLAFKFERYLINKYSAFRLSPQYARLFMESGFTETFSIDILNDLVKEFKID